MNDETTIETGSALVIPHADELPGLFQRGEVDDILERIKSDALSVAPDISTAKGRKEIASLAYKVAQSKTALDNAGKGLTEDARRQIDAVNAERKKIRDTLDDLKVTVRKPLDDWEEAEEKRKAWHREKLAAFHTDQLDWTASSADLAELIKSIKATAVDDSWDEFQKLAQEAKDEALTKFASDLKAAQKREAQEKELEELREAKRLQEERDREEAAKREAEEAERREAEQARERLKQRADDLVAYISEVNGGRIGGRPQPFGILLYELTDKIQIDDSLGEHRSIVETVRDRAVENLTERMEQQAKDKAAREEQEKIEAERRALAEAKEQERLKREAEKKEREKREANKRHRAKILKEIRTALLGMEVDDMPTAMAEGKIPHVTVNF